MWAEMFKTDRLEIWEKDMEGAITPVLYILDDQMRKLVIGVSIIEGVQSFPNYTPSP